MCKDLFGNEFDFNQDGEMDSFEKRAQYTTYLEMLCGEEYGSKNLSDLNNDELNDLIIKSGVDPSGFGI